MPVAIAKRKKSLRRIPLRSEQRLNAKEAFQRPRTGSILWKMNLRFALVLLLATLAPLCASETKSGTAPSAVMLVPIFNGKDLTGWKNLSPNPFWRVVNGVLIGENDEKQTGSMLWTEKSYGNFALELDVRWQGEIDSGIMLRKPELQLQFGVSRSLKRDLTGSFYVGGKTAYPEEGQAKDVSSIFKPGEWNRVRLEARGTTFTVWINGRSASQYSNPKYAEGAPIGLQIHAKLAMKVEFRDIRAAELP